VQSFLRVTAGVRHLAEVGFAGLHTGDLGATVEFRRFRRNA